MIEVTDKVISPERVIDTVRNSRSGCVVTYVGLIRDYSKGKPVLSVTYKDSRGDAEKRLEEIVDEARQRWQVENIAISHRTGELRVGEINLEVAVASAHRREGFAACRYVINQFKQRLPTQKIETYRTATRGLRSEINNDKVKELKAKLADLRARWPAHSVPPRMWQELEELEDELKKAREAQNEQ